MKIAIIHDWLPYVGGAERALACMLELFPNATLYTSVYNRKKMGDYFKGVDIRTSFIDHLPFGKTKHSMYLNLMPYAFEQFDLRGYDVVLSSSTSCAKGVLTDAKTLHICYCNTPMRYAWDFYFDYLNKSNSIIRKVLIHFLMHKIRLWDVLSANRVDYFIANSHNVERRIRKHYRRAADVIYPPVSVQKNILSVPAEGSYYLVVSRLVSYKRVDLAVQAFNQLNLPLLVVGEGPEKKNLEKQAKPNIRFVGRASDEEVAEYYQQCKAFIFPGEEDFGITPVEAQSYGKPVIAYGQGGALETVIDGVTGIFFREHTAEALVDAIKKAEEISFDIHKIHQNAMHFDVEVFKTNLSQLIEQKYALFHENHDKMVERK